MFTRRDLNNIIEGVKSELTNLGYQPEKTILFGSYNNGGVHKYSDIDLAVWNSDFTGNSMIDFENIKSILKKYPKVDIKPFKTGDDNPFIEVIEKTGKIV